MKSIIIKAPITCFDGILESDINILLRLPYFNRYLTTNLGSDQLTLTKTTDKTTKYVITIPEINVDCTVQVCNILLHHKTYYIREYNDLLIDLLIYNDMYMTQLKLESKDDISLIYYIKEQLPNNDPYSILKQGGYLYINKLIVMSFSSLSNDEFKPDIIPDLLHHIKSGLEAKVYDNIREKIDILNVLCKYSEMIPNQLDNEMILCMLDAVFDHGDYILGRENKRGQADDYILYFNSVFDDIKDRISQLINLGFITEIDYSDYQLNHNYII